MQDRVQRTIRFMAYFKEEDVMERSPKQLHHNNLSPMSTYVQM